MLNEKKLNEEELNEERISFMKKCLMERNSRRSLRAYWGGM